MVGEVIVVFYWLKSGGFAEEAEMVGWCWGWEEGLYCWEVVSSVMFEEEWEGYEPSSMPRPERKIGTIDIEAGEIVVVLYSYPSGVLSYTRKSTPE